MNRVQGLVPSCVFIVVCLVSSTSSYGQICPATGNGLFIGSSATRLGDIWTVNLRGLPGLSGVLGIDDATAPSVGPAGTLCLGIANGYTMVPFTLNAMGTARIRRQLPFNVGLDGQIRYVQAMVTDPAAPGGMWLSNSLELEFRAPRILVVDEGVSSAVFGPPDGGRFTSVNSLTGAIDWSMEMPLNFTSSSFFRRAGILMTVSSNGFAEFFDIRLGQLQFGISLGAGAILNRRRAITMARRDQAVITADFGGFSGLPIVGVVRLIDLTTGTILNNTLLPAGELTGTSIAIPRSQEILMAVETPSGFELRRFDPAAGTIAAAIALPAQIDSVFAMTLQGDVIHVQGWASTTQQTVLFRFETTSNSLTLPQGVAQFTGPPPSQQFMARFGLLGAQVATVYSSPTALLVLSDPITHAVTTSVPLESNLPLALSSRGDSIIAFNDQPAGIPDDYTRLRPGNLSSNLVNGPGSLGDTRLSAPVVPRSAKNARLHWIDSSNQLWSTNTQVASPPYLATPLPFSLTGGIWRLFSD